MKHPIKLLSLKAFAIAIAFIAFQSYTPKSENAVVVPADGCAYVGNPNVFCVWGEYGVTNCANTTSTTTCGVDIPIEDN